MARSHANHGSWVLPWNSDSPSQAFNNVCCTISDGSIRPRSREGNSLSAIICNQGRNRPIDQLSHSFDRRFDLAERDINAIVAWLTRRSPIGARNWLVALERALDNMGTQPEAMGLALESSCVKSDLKQCLFKTLKGRTYRAVFLMENKSGMHC